MNTNEAIKDVTKAADKLATSKDEYNKSATERHHTDMISDNWLSKSIRPITLIWLLGLFTWSYIYCQLTGNVADVTLSNLLGSFLTTAIIFYFGSRAAEKIGVLITKTNNKVIKRDSKEKNRVGLFGRLFGGGKK